MLVRLTSIQPQPGKVDELRQIYHQTIVPLVKAQKGNVDVMLLEPTSGGGELISCTMWKSEDDARSYESSGTYQQAVDKLEHTFAKPSTLKSYKVQR